MSIGKTKTKRNGNAEPLRDSNPGAVFYLDYLQKYVKKLLTFNITLYIIINVRLIQVRATGRGDNMTRLNIQAVTEMGCTVYTSINVPEDYTMAQVVKAVKNSGYVMFRLLDTMKVFVRV